MDQNAQTEPAVYTITADVDGKHYEFTYPEGVYSGDIKQVLCGMRDHVVKSFDDNKPPKEKLITAQVDGKEYSFTYPEDGGQNELKSVLLGMRDHVVVEEFKNLSQEEKKEDDPVKDH